MKHTCGQPTKFYHLSRSDRRRSVHAVSKIPTNAGQHSCSRLCTAHLAVIEWVDHELHARILRMPSHLRRDSSMACNCQMVLL